MLLRFESLHEICHCENNYRAKVMLKKKNENFKAGFGEVCGGFRV
jgi:hypothetical protein